jgi:hypothetical protein
LCNKQDTQQNKRRLKTQNTWKTQYLKGTQGIRSINRIQLERHMSHKIFKTRRTCNFHTQKKHAHVELQTNRR